MGPGSADARSEDAHQPIGFPERPVELRSIGQQRDTLDQPQPAPRLAEFLVTDAQFVDEVVSGFGGFCLAVVRERRGT
jgi:hypothetical protein